MAGPKGLIEEKESISPGERRCPSCTRVIPRSRFTCPHCKVGVYRLLVQNEKVRHSEREDQGNAKDASPCKEIHRRER
jgi:hypothetical protein